MYLRECLDSLVCQSLEDIEIIVIENNSTDDTKLIIDEYAQLYPEKIVSLHQPVQGLSAARNMGLEVARGEFIGFVDSDDSVEPDMFEKLYQAVQKNTADMVVCGWNAVYQDSETKKVFQSKHEGFNIFENPRILFAINVFVWNKLYSAKIIKEYNILFDEDLKYCEDGLFNGVYMFYAEKIVHVREALYQYKTKRAGSATAVFNENILSQIAFCEKIANFYKQNGYFNLFKTNLLWTKIGYLRRKLSDAFVTKNRSLAMTYIDSFFSVLEKIYPSEWQSVLRRYGTNNKKIRYKKNFYLPKKTLLALRIYTPNWIIKTLHFIGKTTMRFITLPFRAARWGIKTLKKSKRSRNNYRYLAKVVGHYLHSRDNQPINEQQIVFSPNSGDKLPGNIYYMLEDALKRENYKIYIVSNNPNRDKPMLGTFNAEILRTNSPEEAYALATSKYIATDTRLPDYFIRRDEQILMYTWHGTPLKNLGYDVSNAFFEIGGIQTQFLSADYVLFPNVHTKEKMLRCYYLDKLFTNKGLLAGYPRNAAFYRDHEINELKSHLGIVGKRVYVYMPTWRGSNWGNRDKKYIEKTNLYLQILDNELDGSDVVIFHQLHHYAQKDKKRATNFRNIRPFPNNLETYRLLNCADGLISDYSSVFFDYANTGKEIILFTFDAEEYYATRGMYMHLDDLPFTRVETITDLITHILSGSQYKKSEKYSAFQHEYCTYDSALTPKHVNDIFLGTVAELEHGEIADYSYNANKEYNAYLVSNITCPVQVDEVMQCIENDPDALLIVAERRYSEIANGLIQNTYDKEIPCVIARMRETVTAREKVQLKLYRKFGMYKSTAIKQCIREKERLFPYINIKKYINMSNESLFINMGKFLNDD